MSLSMSIHPQGTNEKGRLRFTSSRQFWADNGNAVTLNFSSRERNARYDFDTVEQEITVYHLSDISAEVLASVGLLNDDKRAELIPILRHMIADQEADAELEAQADA